MEAVLNHLLAVFPPLVAIVEHVDVAPRLEAEPRLPQLSPHLHLSFVRCRRAPPPAKAFKAPKTRNRIVRID